MSGLTNNWPVCFLVPDIFLAAESFLTANSVHHDCSVEIRILLLLPLVSLVRIEHKEGRTDGKTSFHHKQAHQ